MFEISGEVHTPITLPFDRPFGTMTDPNSNWQQLLEVIADSGKHVVLNLSNCQMLPDGIFNPNPTVSTGKNLIIEITLPDAAETIPDGSNASTQAFRNFSQLRSVSGKNIKTIGNWAFNGCFNLTTVSFPLVTSIRDSFWACSSLTSISLPSVTSIGQNAFALTGNTPLTITLGPNAPTLGWDIFDNVTSKTVTVRIPNGATGYSPATSPFNGAQATVCDTDTAANWGNGFRGGGWTESAFEIVGTVNTGITLHIVRIP